MDRVLLDSDDSGAVVCGPPDWARCYADSECDLEISGCVADCRVWNDADCRAHAWSRGSDRGRRRFPQDRCGIGVRWRDLCIGSDCPAWWFRTDPANCAVGERYG